MFKKCLLLFLSLIMCMGSLTSCFIVIDERDDTGVRTEPETQSAVRGPIEKLPPMPDTLNSAVAEAEPKLEGLFKGKNCEGLTFTLVIAEGPELNIEAEQETSYIRALRLQSELISSKFGCSVYVNRTPYSTFLSDAQAAMNSGIFYADAVCIPQKGLGYLKSQGMLADLKGLYGDVFTEEYFDLDSKAQASGMNRLYGIGGEAALNPGALGCVYMNKALADECGITEAVYEAVDNGSWTLDKLLEFRTLCLEKYAEVSAMGAVNAEFLTEAMFGASGMRYMTSAPDGLPAVAANGQSLDNFIAKMRGLVYDTALCTYTEDPTALFTENKLLFYVDTLKYATSIKGSYTVLPLPKIDGEQDKYYTHTTSDAYVFAVLTTNNRPEYAVDIIKALNGVGGMYHEALARDLLDYAFSNEMSYKYAKEIFKSQKYEFAYMFGDVYTSVADSSYNALRQAVLNNAVFNNYVGGQTWRLRNELNVIFG